MFESLFILVLAIFIGFEVISKIPATLHTPLMSGANAISGITLIGALLLVRHDASTLSVVIATIAVTMAMINVVGGYLVTNRMLSLFRKKQTKKQEK